MRLLRPLGHWAEGLVCSPFVIVDEVYSVQSHIGVLQVTVVIGSPKHIFLEPNACRA